MVANTQDNLKASSDSSKMTAGEEKIYTDICPEDGKETAATHMNALKKNWKPINNDNNGEESESSAANLKIQASGATDVNADQKYIEEEMFSSLTSESSTNKIDEEEIKKSSYTEDSITDEADGDAEEDDGLDDSFYENKTIKDEEQSSEPDEHSNADNNEDDSDGVMILDSSDEEKEREAVERSEKRKRSPNTSTEMSADNEMDKSLLEEDSDDYDDDDLMNDVIISTKNSSNIASTSKAIAGNKMTLLVRHRKKMKRAFNQLNFRCHMKNRSIKWLNAKLVMHNVSDDKEISMTSCQEDESLPLENIDDDMLSSHESNYEYETENNEELLFMSAKNISTSSTPKKIEHTNVIIELDSSPEKSPMKSGKTEYNESKHEIYPTEILSKSDNKDQIQSLPQSLDFEPIYESETNKNIEVIEDICEKNTPIICSDASDAKKIKEDPENNEKGLKALPDDQNIPDTIRNVEQFESIVTETDTLNKDTCKASNTVKTEIKETSNSASGEISTLKSDLTSKEVEFSKMLKDHAAVHPETAELQEKVPIQTPSKDNMDAQQDKSEKSEESSETISKFKCLTGGPSSSHSRKRLLSVSLDESQPTNTKVLITTSTPILSPELYGNSKLDSQKSNNLEYNAEPADTEDTHFPIKKLRAELQTNFCVHDRILSDYIEQTTNDSAHDIEKHINELAIEIQTLNNMIKAKEFEWNNILHLKKVKEEICLRLSRKKNVMQLMTGEGCNVPNTSTEDSQTNTFEFSTKNVKVNQNPICTEPNLNENQNRTVKVPNINSTSEFTDAETLSLLNYTGNSLGSGPSISTAQSILNNRANMKRSDLAREKVNTQKLHRLLVSRSILPKPASTTSNSSATASSSVNAVKFGSGSLFGSEPAPSSGGKNAMQHQQQQQQQFPLTLSSITGSSVMNNLSFNSNNNNGRMYQQQPILNNYLTAAASVQKQLGEIFSGNQQQYQNVQNLMVGRQGVFKDVKSIIADYRQRHPEQVPRRGRRMKSTSSNEISGGVHRGNNLDLNMLLNKFEGNNSRPSSNDSSSHSMSNVLTTGTNLNSGTTSANVSFKDALLQIARIGGQNSERLNAAAGNSSSGKSCLMQSLNTQQHQRNLVVPPYPEVTLHPVSTTNLKKESTGSLLHGILTKYNRPNLSQSATVPLNVNSTMSQQSTCTPTSTTNNFNSTFSPTLAKLLTAPEKMANVVGNNSHHSSDGAVSGMLNNKTGNLTESNSSVLNLSKVVGHNSEITITPVLNSHLNLHQPLQQQQQVKDALRHSSAGNLSTDRMKGEHIPYMDDEADDSVDRLVIDEGGDSSVGPEEQYKIAPRAIGQEFNENEVPGCQGCKKQEAQFVCAGCGNQWYCSRECQVQSWDEHSEVCTG